MPAIAILNGIKAGGDAGFDLNYPTNLEPVPAQTGISNGYLRSAAGVRQIAAGVGQDRGRVNWNGVHYRVSGTKLIKIAQNNAVTVIGDVGSGGQAVFDYGFDRLAINSGDRLYYYDGTTLTQVTDSDLGAVNDMLWINGYYATTDGTSIVVTDLSNPFSVNPLKYGSAEEDPDMVVGLFKLRGELYALGSYTIQVFNNIGGSGFPFAANTAATVPVGIVGRNAKCRYLKTLAFVGQEREDETPTAPGVYLLDGGSAAKISTRAIDDELAKVADLTSIIMESRTYRDERRLLIHLPDRTLVYCANASRISEQPCWYIARAGLGMDRAYRSRGAVFVYGQWYCADPETGNIGVLDETISTQFGEESGWQFDTMLVYNEGNGGILHSLELAGLPGRAAMGEQPRAFMSTTIDGQFWSTERAASTGARGDTSKRVQWRPHRRFRHYIGLRFRGASNALAGWAACQCQIEPLR